MRRGVSQAGASVTRFWKQTFPVHFTMKFGAWHQSLETLVSSVKQAFLGGGLGWGVVIF